MTRVRTVELDCTSCSTKRSVDVYDSINVSLDPTLKEKLFKGEINFFQCEKCKEKAFIPVPLLYHDMEKHILVQFYPFDLVEDKTFLEQFSKDGEWSSAMTRILPRKLKGFYKGLHIVFDMGELIRYIIFRDKLHNLWGEAS
jgi:hypothetical protein